VSFTVITNEPGANFVVSADIGSNGQLVSNTCHVSSIGYNFFCPIQRLRQAVNAQGKGAHGINTEGDGPDALFSQGAVKASAKAKMLATVNVGPSAQVFFILNNFGHIRRAPTRSHSSRSILETLQSSI
jgi:hypothetical protein